MHVCDLRLWVCCAALSCVSLLSGCSGESASNPGADLRTLPVKSGRAEALVPTSPLVSGRGIGETRITAGPPPPSEPPAPSRTESSIALSGPPATLTVEQMPLPAFINMVLGDTLHLNFQIDPKVAQRNELVTLRTSGPRPPGEIFALTRTVLHDYGIEVAYDGQLARVLANDTLLSQSPNIIRGRSTSEISENLRPVFQYVPMTSASAAEMASWLQNALGAKIKITPSPTGNALLILGLPEDVQAANEAIRTLDQPRFAGRRSLRVEPVYWSAGQLAEKLTDILRAEGYSVSSGLQNPGAVTLVPLRPSNVLVVFTADQKTLVHVEEWTRDLDRASQVDPQRSVFLYPVRNTTAESLAAVLNAVLQGTQAARSAAAPPPPGAPPPPPTAQQQQPQSRTEAMAAALGRSETAAPGNAPPGRIVTDPARNAIIFQGSAEEFGHLRPLIESLDQAPREAIIEVTVAEVTLNSSETLGVEGILKFGALGQPHQVLQTIGTGIGSVGLNYTILNAAGATRAILNAFATTGRVKVLSTPKLLSRSGGEAKIQVGKQVPIITSQGTSSQLQVEGTSAILQTVQYKDTGVILTVKPTIYAGDQVDLEIRQEVSNAEPNSISALASTPVIDTRQVSTQLSLRDGATVLLGGLIAENDSNTSNGVPFLKDVPGVGFLFGTQNVQKSRSELFVFITPYIVNSGQDAARLMESFKNRYETLPQPLSTLHW
jgi:general secretion pathway protein D